MDIDMVALRIYKSIDFLDAVEVLNGIRSEARFTLFERSVRFPFPENESIRRSRKVPFRGTRYNEGAVSK